MTRGRTVLVSVSDRDWVPVVVVDHPGIDNYEAGASAVVLLRRDWEFLFEQLKSTFAVLAYLHRVHSGVHAVRLGEEPLRYYRLAAADVAAPPQPLDPRVAAMGARAESVPALPQAPAPFGELVRAILEDIAALPCPEGMSESDLLAALAAVDAAPVGMRDALGRAVLRMLAAVSTSPEDEIRWWFRRIYSPDRPYLALGVASRHGEDAVAWFGDFVALRHQQLGELIPERLQQLTVGVLLTPRYDAQRQWDTTLVATRGEQGFGPDSRAGLERLWGGLEAGRDYDVTLSEDPFAEARKLDAG